MQRNPLIPVLLFLLIAILIDWMRRTFKVPIAVFDILAFFFLPLSFIFIRAQIKVEKNKLKNEKSGKPFFIVFICLLLFIMGVASFYIGVTSPLDYIASVKGYVHGYSLIPMGFFSLSLVYIFASSLKK